MATVRVFYEGGGRYRGKQNIINCAQRALKGEKLGKGAVSIVLTSDVGIRKLHRQWMGKDSTTDVITFPIDVEPPIYGEIYISIDTARRNAERFGVTLTNELCRLAVHGVLHLAGYDDQTDAERQEMHKRENRYIGGL